ncbi:MAG: RagB/SusD family nutrient uptake outer membrane protein [Flavobacteriales bacterium]|nr:RagB/SusD family nutrient uptake outer membrane protein [Flavobacteriales bacterium]
MDVSGSAIPYLELLDHYTPYGIERSINETAGAGGKMATVFAWEALWAYSYTAIARCNTVLDGAKPYMEKFASEPKSMQYISEIKTLRAYFYYMLVNLFGEVPLMTTAYLPKEEWMNVTRRPVAEVLDSMFKDLDEAATWLPWSYSATTDWGRANKSFALGLKARMALNQGSILAAEGKTAEATKYFEIARDAAKDIMDNSGRDLASDYEALFTNAGQATAEVKNEIIFELMYAGDATLGKTNYLAYGCGSRNIAQSGRFPTNLLVDTYEMANGKRIDEEGSGYNPDKPFINRDPRLHYNIYTHGDIMIGNNGEKVKFVVELFNIKTQFWNYNTEEWETRVNRDRDGGLQQYAFAENGVGYMWKKYLNFDDIPQAANNTNYVIMRYAEILLTYAEAKIELGELDGTVYAAMNKVRNRAGMPDVAAEKQGNQQLMRQLVRRERKVELPREGLTLFDLRRWRIGDIANAEPTYGFPIWKDPATLSKNKDSYDGFAAYATSKGVTAVPDYAKSTPTDLDGSRHNLNDIPSYEKYKDMLRVRDERRYWDEAFNLSPIPQTERNKAPQITQNKGYDGYEGK